MNRFAVYPSLQDRSVLITGGASGIGASLVEHFARQGSKVAFLDIQDEAANTLIKQLGPESRHSPVFVHCDLINITELQERLREVVQEVGAIQVLVNNAGNDDRHSSEEVTAEYWDQRMAINLRHYFFTIQAVAPAMKEAKAGSIINVSSIAWIIPSTRQVAYISAKAAVVGLSRTMARELGEWNIRVNSVLPGAILTERQRRLWLTPQYEAEVNSRQSLKRSLLPEEVARLVLFLAADDSSAITNQSHVIDGGWV